MPKVKRSRKAPPDGWELIEPTLDELDQKMREAETEPHEGKRKVESLWPIFRIHHQKTRYIFDLFYKRKAISRELYEYCIKEGYADKNLIAKWKKQGYENLCCLRCIQTRDTNFGTNCICRVPKSKLEVRVASSSAHTVAAGVALADTLDSAASWTLDLGLVLIGPLPPEATLLRVALREDPGEARVHLSVTALVFTS
ncbi:Protein BUD31 homolog [Apodemus speciosus]|uniref:Protein BUD31 homolog n=1 Tax=Apodemus speciosus TaxID=105296 RepID=A0ABQ0EU78_APOSI